MHSLQLGIALAIVPVVWILKRLYDELTSPIRHVPGPPLARFTRWWYFATVWKGDAHETSINLHKRYAAPGQYFAPIVRLGPNLFSVASPDKAIYGISSKMPKSPWYKGWSHPDPNMWNIFADHDIQHHNQTRKKFQAMYSLSSLLHYEGQVDAVQDVFRERLQEIAKSNVSIDVHHWLQCYAFDVIGSITFGGRFGFLDKGEDVQNQMRALDVSMIYSTLVGVFHQIHPYLFYLLGKVSNSGAAGREALHSLVRTRIADRRALFEAGKGNISVGTGEGDTRDFLDIALNAERRGEKGMTNYDVQMMAIVNIGAGSDTTAISLSSILWHLVMNPTSLQRLRHEIDECIGSGLATADHISFKEGQKLPYFQACIKEGLRLCSATGLPLWRVVPHGGAEILGQFFPEGSEVGTNSWVAHYDEDVWGTDVAEFRPERWLVGEANSERRKRLEENYMPFGLGSRTCLGKHISYLEITKLLPMIVTNFDIVLDPSSARTLETKNFWFVKPTNFRATLRACGQDGR